MRHLCVWFALLIALGVTLNAVPSRAADKADTETIEKLVKQLASGRFAAREQAQKQLEQIGPAALDALKKAVETGDMETKRRASELISKFENKAQGAKVLAPTKVSLSYKDVPVKDALADFSKKTGYNFTLVDPENKLKDRKVTLETGDTTFWQALDKFCAAARLIEADPQDLQGQPVPQPFDVPPQPLPPIRIQPVPPVQIQPGIRIKPGIAPRPIQRLPLEKKPVEKQVPQIEKLPPDNALQVQVEKAVPAQAAQAQPARVQILPAQQAQQVAPAVQIRRRPFIQPQPVQPGVTNLILLKDGDGKVPPTDYTGAVRVRLMENAQMFGAAAKDEILLGLKVSPEPKIRWQQLVNLRIDKAIDENDQKLMPVMGKNDVQPGQVNPFGQIQFRGFARPAIGFGGGFPGQGFGGLHQYIPVRLTRAEKPAKSLKELTGLITAQVLTEAEVHIEAKDIMKAAGKTFKGKESGSIKVNAVTEQNGQIVLQLEVENPRDVVPAGQIGNPFGVGVPWNGPIQILPALPIAPVPQAVPAPALPKGALQVQFQAKAQAKAQVQIQIQQIQIGGGGIAIGPGFIGNGGGSHVGLELLDEKGNVIPMVNYGQQFRGAPGGGAFTPEHHMVFQPQKDQKAAKLVYKGSKSVNVEIPFSLKDVKLP